MNQIFTPCLASGYALVSFLGQFFDSPRRANRQGSYWDAGAIWMFAGACLCLLIMSVLVPKLHMFWMRARLNSPSVLFRQLCKAHKLNHRSVRLLSDLANARQLLHPSLLFVEPQHFELRSLPAVFGQRAEELSHLRQQLFSLTDM